MRCPPEEELTVENRKWWERLATARGADYWRSLEELAQEPGRLGLPEQEGAALLAWAERLDRRQFLGLLGASLALAGLSGCAQAPAERLVPYVRQPEGMLPGRLQYFATAQPLAGFANGGLLVASYLGRPIKVEGNPDHPWSPRPLNSPAHVPFGPSDLFAQASLLGLYDPDRAQTVRYRYRETRSWEEVRAVLAEVSRGLRAADAERPRVRILTGEITSPTLLHQLRQLLPAFPRGWHQHEPTRSPGALAGLRLAFRLPAGRAVSVHYRLERARRLLSLDSDFLACGPGHLRYARDFVSQRLVRREQGQPAERMNRLYVVESSFTVTGAKADHRLPLKPSQIARFALALARQLGVPVGAAPSEADLGLPAGYLRALADDLRRFPGQAVVLPGEGQPPLVHALAHVLNAHLGSIGPDKPVVFTQAVGTEHLAGSLAELVDDLRAGRVETLLILGVNPVYTAPADLDFATALEQARLSIHLSPYFDETAAHCHWHIPEAHYLESWGDVRAPDGTVSVIQPLIAPLYQGRTASEVLAVLRNGVGRPAFEIVQDYWEKVFQGARSVAESLSTYAELENHLNTAADFEDWWRQGLHQGYIAGTQAPCVTDLTVRPDLAEALAAALPAHEEGPLEVVFRPDPTLFDGQFANNGWLQELPKPLSHLTWGTAAFLSPRTAVQQGLASSERPDDLAVATGRLVQLRRGTLQVDQVPVYILPGHPEGCVTLYLGHGRERAGRVGDGVGFSAYRLLSAALQGQFAGGLRLTPRAGRQTLAITQKHHQIVGQQLIRSGKAQDYPQLATAAPAEANPRRTLSLYPDEDYRQGSQWGMSIDLTLCLGCQACVVACQAENNIPVVGKDQVLAGREMHWLRVDSYYRGEPADSRSLEVVFQPVPCMHCENAPCELVCPVEATVHSHDGLNDMIYNRCVGTRYCSNNCPYKVRRFNFLQYADFTSELARLGRNPEVTVRSRGVMEKCTYCVQRIRRGEAQAAAAERPLADGEIQPACQAACPVGAIVFGDLNGRDAQGRPSLVARLQAEPTNYGLLADLNTRPRTTYLYAFRNPNPELPD